MLPFFLSALCRTIVEADEMHAVRGKQESLDCGVASAAAEAEQISIVVGLLQMHQTAAPPRATRNFQS
jgi:hypothetical protein